jgi:hypothetical protein
MKNGIRKAGRFCFLIMIAALLGCGRGSTESEYLKIRKSQEVAADNLRTKGMVVETRRYPQGEAVAIALKGATVDDALFERLKTVGHITELDLSGTNITDEQMARLNEKAIGSLLLILDLSNTQVSDEGLAKLDNLLLLMNLKVKGTKITAEGVQNFLDKRRTNPSIPNQFKTPTVER